MYNVSSDESVVKIKQCLSNAFTGEVSYAGGEYTNACNEDVIKPEHLTKIRQVVDDISYMVDTVCTPTYVSTQNLAIVCLASDSVNNFINLSKQAEKCELAYARSNTSSASAATPPPEDNELLGGDEDHNVSDPLLVEEPVNGADTINATDDGSMMNDTDETTVVEATTADIFVTTTVLVKEEETPKPGQEGLYQSPNVSYFYLITF